ncbi:MAG: hypothetical protein ACI8Q2_000571 [Candidatus Omnitrophota bacterium]|jgi:hypothetical protein
MLDKFKKKWGITSSWSILAILVTFSLAGMSIVYVRKPIFNLVGITAETPFILKFFLWLLIVFPTYQINLLIFGTLLGQFSFFWEKEKKMASALLRVLTFKKRKALNK